MLTTPSSACISNDFSDNFARRVCSSRRTWKIFRTEPGRVCVLKLSACSSSESESESELWSAPAPTAPVDCCASCHLRGHMARPWESVSSCPLKESPKAPSWISMDPIVVPPSVLKGLPAHASAGAACRSKGASPSSMRSEAKSGWALCRRGAVWRHAGQRGAGPPAAVESLHTQNRVGWRSSPARACMATASLKLVFAPRPAAAPLKCNKHPPQNVQSKSSAEEHPMVFFFNLLVEKETRSSHQGVNLSSIPARLF